MHQNLSRRALLGGTAGALGVATLGLPRLTTSAAADVKGKDHVQAVNIQAEPGQQLDSASVAGVFRDLKTLGANAVVLNPTLVQDTPTSTSIRRRPAKFERDGTKVVEASPTDDQLRRAIRNARKAGLAVIIKPHLELVDGSWRAKIVSSPAWHAAWTRWLVHYAQLAREEGASTLVIGVEQKGASLPKAATPLWLDTIAQLRRAAPGLLLTYAFHTGDELLLADPAWVKKLDYVSATWYPRFDEKHTYTSMKRKMKKDRGEFDQAWRRYRLKIVLAETGVRSLEYAHRFAKAGTAEYRDAKADEKIQEVWYHALLHTVEGWEHLDGVMLYRTLNSSTAGGKTDKGFTFQGKKAEATVARYFGGKVPRRS